MAGRVVPVATGGSLPERPCESMPGRLVHPIRESSRGRFAAATLQKFPCGRRAEYCTSMAAPTRVIRSRLFVQSSIQDSGQVPVYSQMLPAGKVNGRICPRTQFGLAILLSNTSPAAETRGMQTVLAGGVCHDARCVLARQRARQLCTIVANEQSRKPGCGCFFSGENIRELGIVAREFWPWQAVQEPVSYFSLKRLMLFMIARAMRSCTPASRIRRASLVFEMNANSTSTLGIDAPTSTRKPA